MKSYVAKKCTIFIGVWFKEGLWKYDRQHSSKYENVRAFLYWLFVFEKNPGIYHETSVRTSNSWRKKSDQRKARI